MQTIENEQEAQLSRVPIDLDNEPLTPLAAAQLAEYEQDDDPDVIFMKAVAEIDTQPLPKQQAISWPFVLLTIAVFFSFLGGTTLALLTSPTATIEIVPLRKTVSFTTQLAIPLRTLAPVTLVKTATTTTTGHGHQEARTATGSLVFYNGLFTQQYIASGTVFAGRDGIKVITTAAATLPSSNPSANPPRLGSATVPASATRAGAAGNIASDDVNATVVNGVSVKNTSPFSHGRDARNYRAVAQSDLESVTSTLKARLIQQIPRAFVLRSGEAVQTTACLFKATPNHQAGDEAQTVTVTTTETCKGSAYNQSELEVKADSQFTQQTRPGLQYQRIGTVAIHLESVTPVTVSCSGSWVYTLSQDYQQYLAQEIAGDSPQQANRFLLGTGVLTQATVPHSLPQDPGHIHFQVVVM